MTKDFLDTKIDDLDLSIRTKNKCKMNEIKVLKDLISYSFKDLMYLNFSKASISEIQELLISKGYVSVALPTTFWGFA